MSLIRGKNILKKFFKRPKINWSNYEFESSLQLNEFVDQLLEPIENSQSSYLIKLGLHEALVNAVKHGNKLDPTKNIRVRRIITPKWCVWQIQDQVAGRGTDLVCVAVKGVKLRRRRHCADRQLVNRFGFTIAEDRGYQAARRNFDG